MNSGKNTNNQEFTVTDINIQIKQFKIMFSIIYFCYR